MRHVDGQTSHSSFLNKSVFMRKYSSWISFVSVFVSSVDSKREFRPAGHEETRATCDGYLEGIPVASNVRYISLNIQKSRRIISCLQQREVLSLVFQIKLNAITSCVK